MKKIIALILALCMLVALGLTGCAPTEEQPPASDPGTSTPGTSDPGTSDPGTSDPVLEEPAEISVILWANGAPPAAEALALVNEKLNEITVPAINTIVNVQIWDVGTYIGTSATAVGAGDDIDLMCTFPAAAPHYSNMSAQGMLLPLNDLLAEYAPEIMDLIPERWWQATTKDGEILGVPVYANKTITGGIFVVKEWFEELGYKPEDIKTLDDVHEMLKAFHCQGTGTDQTGRNTQVPCPVSRLQTLQVSHTKTRHRLHQPNQHPPVGGPILPKVDRWQTAIQECLRPHP